MVSKSVLVWESKIPNVPFTMVSSKTDLESEKSKNDASYNQSAIDELFFHRSMLRIPTKSYPWPARYLLTVPVPIRSFS
jgi:hypothetical protein